ncbi:MAG: hypothetical protein AAGE94_10210 [Acidobacteriota bacterium]
MHHPVSDPSSLFHRWRLAAAFSVHAGLVTVAAPVAEAQRVVRPRSLWGRVHEQPESFGFGGVELLATLAFVLVVLFLVAAWLGLRALAMSRVSTVHGPVRDVLRHQVERRGMLLGQVIYLATPIVGITATVLAPSRVVFGAQIATWIVCLSAATVSVGAVALILDHGSRRRLDL